MAKVDCGYSWVTRIVAPTMLEAAEVVEEQSLLEEEFPKPKRYEAAVEQRGKKTKIGEV